LPRRGTPDYLTDGDILGQYTYPEETEVEKRFLENWRVSGWLWTLKDGFLSLKQCLIIFCKKNYGFDVRFELL